MATFWSCSQNSLDFDTIPALRTVYELNQVIPGYKFVPVHVSKML